MFDILISIMTIDVKSISDMIKLVSDNGIMLVMAIILIVYTIKNLNALSKQSNQITTIVIPKMEEIETNLSLMTIKYNESETRRNLSVNKQFADLSQGQKEMVTKLKAINRELMGIKQSLDQLNSEIEKQHVYMDFYQEQLKKDR